MGVGMKRFALFFFFLMITYSVLADVYKWTDSSGEVHFSDTPRSGAEKVDLPEVQTYSSPPIPPAPVETSSTDESDQATYKKITIVQPQDQATIRNNEGSVAVAVQLEPGLKAGDKFQLIYDGTSLGQPQTTPVFTVKGIYRGSHTLSVQVLDSKNNVLITSQTITIFMHQSRVGMGGRGR